MIKINTYLEFRKGILFVRINGVITKDTSSIYSEDVNEVIKINGIKKVVLNLKKVKEIDLKGINLLFYTYELTKNNKGSLYFTNINNIKEKLDKSHLLKYVDVLENELVSFELA